jgi:hypothetical protein
VLLHLLRQHGRVLHGVPLQGTTKRSKMTLIPQSALEYAPCMAESLAGRRAQPVCQTPLESQAQHSFNDQHCMAGQQVARTMRKAPPKHAEKVASGSVTPCSVPATYMDQG